MEFKGDTLYIREGETIPTVDIEPTEKFATDKIIDSFASLEMSIKMAKQAFDNFLFAICGIRQQVLDMCPNKRVVHLATHGSPKTKKKNLKRAIRIVERRATNGREQN